jgi:predicted RNA-binding protein YlxR (DUF448 family)
VTGASLATAAEGPVRSCIGCGAKKPKRELRRLVAGEGTVTTDPHQTAPGRGAYLCGAGCLTAAVKRKALQRAFRGKAQTLELLILETALQRELDRRRK